MEEFFQLIMEVVLQAVLEIVVDAVWRTMPPGGRTALKILTCAGIAALCGWLSSLAFPEPILTHEGLRVTYLVIGPVVLGAAMSGVGRLMSARGKKRTSLESFGFGWLFAFTFALTRLVATS
jgi:hypothetical protein